jgi:hypothetical protein
MTRISPSNITSLKPNEIFVFGSNLSGIHGGGAAHQAMKWGAKWNQGVGLQGQTYAIPTKYYNISRTLTVKEIEPYVNEFIMFAIENKQYNFMVTEIGCGLAGMVIEDIAPLFKQALDVENIYLPERFVLYLNTLNNSLN